MGAARRQADFFAEREKGLFLLCQTIFDPNDVRKQYSTIRVVQCRVPVTIFDAYDVCLVTKRWQLRPPVRIRKGLATSLKFKGCLTLTQVIPDFPSLPRQLFLVPSLL